VWNSALQTGDPEKVASLYAPDGILLPTVSNKVRTDHAGKVDYFTSFLQLKPFGVIDQSIVRFLTPEKDVGSNSGIYTFSLVKEGQPVKVGGRGGPAACYTTGCCLLLPAFRNLYLSLGACLFATLALRFTFISQLCTFWLTFLSSASPFPLLLQVQARYSFVYRKIDGEWKITEHHSSAMPEPVVDPLEEVAEQFNIWNAALQTGDPEKVASLYAPDGVLLPTVSNKVRPDHASKVDYFTSFLKLKPFGTIDESNVRFLNAAKTLAANSGIYTFALEKEGQPVKVRWGCCCALGCELASVAFFALPGFLPAAALVVLPACLLLLSAAFAPASHPFPGHPPLPTCRSRPATATSTARSTACGRLLSTTPPPCPSRWLPLPRQLRRR
jgi:uncharacterized protein (TIGR02246 family)